MKKIIALSIITITTLQLTVAPALALTSTPAPKSSASSSSAAMDEKLNIQINQLKERIASRVAELNLVEKRAVIGTVTETSGNQITLKDLTGKTRYIDVDEITKFSSVNAKTGFGLSDIVKGTKISVLGLYNKQTQRILARFIETFIAPVYISGRISKIDDTNFTITIISENKKESKVDIRTVTRVSTHTKEDDITKIGFSKLNVGDNVIATGYPDKDDSQLLAATRLLVLNELPANPKIIIAVPSQTQGNATPKPTTKPTSASGQ